MVQLAPAAILVPQLFANPNEDASVPVTEMLVMVRDAFPVLVSVTDCDALVAPRLTEPSERLVDERVISGPTPVPVNAMVCDELAVLAVMDIAAVRAPAATGVKCP